MKLSKNETDWRWVMVMGLWASVTIAIGAYAALLAGLIHE